jgi:hypothetical protein
MKHLKAFESFIELKRGGQTYLVPSNTIPLNEIGKEEFKQLLHSNCSQFLEVIRQFSNGREVKSGKKFFIFRKFPENLGQFVFTNPKDSNIERVAPWSEWGNWHNLLLSNLESWSEYPKRNKCLIGASHGRAFTHGGTDDYLIIPYDTTKIGLCPKDDIWDSFKTKTLYLSKWVSLIIKMVGDLNGVELTDDKNWSNLLPYLDKKYLQEDFIWDVPQNRTAVNKNLFFVIGKGIVYDNDKTLLENLNHFLSPEFNNFSLLTFGGVSDRIRWARTRLDAKEIWFEDEALLIDWKWLTQRMSDEDFSDIFLSR